MCEEVVAGVTAFEDVAFVADGDLAVGVAGLETSGGGRVTA